MAVEWGEQMSMKYEQIKPYIEEKLISEQLHPENENVRIFNYTQKCQFNQAWDDVTRQCRGLIMDVSTGEILARPFPKFFNYKEMLDKGMKIPDGEMVISEKLDGSLGILYTINGKPRIATRGSFTSDQAQWATEWWWNNIGEIPKENETHLFEIIYPANRIVVAYDFSGLVHLSSRETDTGKEIDCTWSKIPKAKTYPNTDLEKLTELDEPNSEGFVVFFPEHNERLKIKFPEYVKLHKIMTGLSEIGIWEMLKEGKDVIEIIQDAPDEMHKWVKNVVASILEKFVDIERVATQWEEKAKDLPTRKEQAEIITQSPYPGIAFSMLDGKDYKQGIWRMVRPNGQSTFKVDIDQ